MAETLGAFVRRHRLERGWTQAQLAEFAGIHRVTVAKIETNADGASFKMILRLAKALPMDLNVFVEESSGMGIGMDDGRPD